MAKAIFAPIPSRAIGDSRLNGECWRVLAAICSHDRFSTRRQSAGCYASHETLAKEANVNYTNLSVAISRLKDCGYIINLSHPTNRRLRVYRVVYDDTLPNDKPNTLSGGKQSPADRNGNGNGNGAVSEPLPAADDSLPNGPGIVCQSNLKREPTQQLSDNNIFRINGTKDIPYKRRINSSEETSLRDAATNEGNEGALLAQIERSHIRSSLPLTAEEITTLEAVMFGHERDDNMYGWARRIFETWEEPA